MTWTYDLALLATTPLFQVRFYCGDTDTTNQQAQDEEINFVLAGQPNVVLAAAIVCDALAAKYAPQADARVGDVSESSSQKAEAFRQRAKDLRSRAASIALPIFGGIYKTQKDALDQDASLVQPTFRIGQDDHPGLRNERDSRPDDWPWDG